MSEHHPLNIPLMELRYQHCREVTGTGEDGFAVYCGHPRSGMTSYCLHHRRINLVMVAPDTQPQAGRIQRSRSPEVGMTRR